MRKSVKRVIAGVLSAVLSLSLVNFSALSMSLASELSGYEIGVEYSEDNTSATLVGEVSGVKENVQLDKLVDSQGQELDPTTFSQTVEENGTYHFTLYYQETVDTQDADQPTTEEKTQELEVVVDGIGKPKVDQPAPTATPEVLEGVQMGTEDAKDAPSPFVQKQESMTAAPRTVPLNVLQRNMAQARATKWIEIRADEADYKLESLEFGGGPLVEGAEGLPTVSGRTFARADFINDETGTIRAINGLYSYNGKWYYTIDETAVDGGDAGTLYVGFELPSNTTVRLHYRVSNTERSRLDAYGSGADLANDFKMYLNGQQNYYYLLYAPGTKIVLEFGWPLALSGFSIDISNVGNYNINDAQKLGNNTLTENQIWETSDQKYTLVFTMPEKDVTINFNGTKWTNADIRHYAIGTDFEPGNNETFNNTSTSDFYGDFSGSMFKAISDRPVLSPGLVSAAEVKHTASGLTYSPRPYVFQVNKHGTSSGTKSLQFAQGDFRSGQMVGFVLRMDRRDAKGAYSWKPNSLVLNAYIGQSYDTYNRNFRQYTIELTDTPTFGSNSTKWTYLDCGARVQTDCWEWSENVYFYRIYVYDMVHNFTLYDRPGRTDDQNFVIGSLDGISVAGGGESLNIGTDSYISEGGPYEGGARALHENDDFQATQLKMNENRYETNFYIRPQYGYTAPQSSTTDLVSNTNLSRIGAITGDNLYQYTLTLPKPWDDTQKYPTYTDGATKGPARISFTSQPVTFAVGYYYQGNQYNNPGISLTASGDTSYYSIQNILPGGLTNLKGYELKVYDSGGNEIATIPNSYSNTGLWYPYSDIVNFGTVYDYLMQQRKVPSDQNCVLRIVPVAANAGEGSVQAQIQIKEQNKFAALDNNNASNRNLTTTGENANATPILKTVNAYVGNSVSVFGNEKSYQNKTTGKYYLYNETASTPTGTVTAENPIAVNLEYVLATKVTVDEGTLGSGNNGATWNQSQLNNLYTSVNNFNHQFDLGGLTEGTLEGQVFTGWGIKKSNNEVVPITNSMKWQNNLNFYMVGQADPDLWSDIFNNGTCTLVAMWKSDIPVVTSDDGNITNKDTNIVIKHNSNETYEVVGTFKYGTETVTQDDLDQAFSSKKLKIALLFKDPQIPGQEEEQWGMRYENGLQNTYFGEPTIKHVAGSTFTVTFTSNKGTADSWTDGGNFRIFAWTESNQGTENLTADLIAQKLTEAGDANPYEGSVPSVNVLTKKVYPVDTKSPGEETVNADVTQDGVKLTTDFHYGYDQNRYPNNSFTKDMLKALIDDSTIQVKLERKTTDGGNWETVNQSGLITAGDNGTITFNYTLGNNLLDYNNNQFRVKVWTAANGDVEDNYPSYIFKVQINVEQVTLTNGSLANENAPNITILHNVASQTYQVVGTFKYGNGSITQEQLDKLFANGTLQIGLLFKDPEISGVTSNGWQVRYQNGDEAPFFGKPSIQKVNNTFTVTFTSSQGISEKWMDGGNFRIFAWTISNPEAGSLTVENIKDQLNSAQEGANPFDGKVPSVNVLTKKVYQISAEGTTEETVTPKVTETNVVLSTSFRYDFDTNRYPGTSFSQTMLEELLNNDTIKVKLERKTTATGEWSMVGEESSLITAGENGTLSFSYTLNGSILDYDNNQFRITVWTEANGSNQPSHTFTVKTTVEPIKNVNGQEAPVDVEKSVEANVNSSLTLESSFRYGGDGTEISPEKLEELIDAGKIHIALLKMDPKISDSDTVVWANVYGAGDPNKVPDPDVTKGDANTFKVSFQASTSINGRYDDGAKFRIVVWTDANTNNNSVTGAQIVEAMNSQEGAPDISSVPWEHFNVSVLYQIQGKEETASFPAEATQSDVVLTTTFHYDYDTDRYPSGFDQGMLQTLIDNGDIQVKLEKMTTADGNWTPVEGQTGLIEAGANGTINFSYTLTGKFYSYDNQQFKVSVWTAANGSTYPSHTFIVEASPSKIFSADGSIGNTVVETPIEIKDGQTEDLTVTAEFMYGNGTAPSENIDEMVKAGLIHIALLIKDPTTGGSWQVRYPVDGTADFTGPDITAGKSGDTFQVTFTEESSQLTGKWSDGAEFLVYAWTETNRAGLTATDIRDSLNNTQGEKPYESLYANEVPSVYTYTTKLYKVTTNDLGDKSYVEANVLGSGLTLTTTFQYDYDISRYPDNSFTNGMLDTLIKAGKIEVSVERKTSGSEDWNVVDGLTGLLSAGDNGTITFTYAISSAGLSLPEFLAYDGNEFRVRVWTAANGTAPESYPSHTFVVDITADAITNEGGVPGPVEEKPVEGNVGGGLALEAKFRYGDGTATPDQIKALIDEGVIKIALLKIDPDLEIKDYTVSWRNVPYDGSTNAIPKPKITQEDGSTDFTVTFEQVSQSLNGTFDDGARFRMYVWTDANAANPDGTSISITQIANDLNSVEGGAEPTITALPWVHYNLSLLYKVTNNSGDVEDTIEVLSTATSIQLSGTFKYDYDGTRYWKGFSAEKLKTLIDGNKFSSKVEYQKKGESTWTEVPGAQVSLTAADSGIMNFSYAFTDASGTLEGYDGAQFKVTVWSGANGTDATAYPFYTITVTFISDPTAYVDIPKYIILDDNSSKVVEGDAQQDGYAGKQVDVKYNKDTMAATFKPSIEVKVQDGVLLKEGSINGAEMADMPIGIYDAKGAKIQAEADGYSSVGTLTSSTPEGTISFWMNTPRGTVKNQQYYATVMFMLEMAGTVT